MSDMIIEVRVTCPTCGGEGVPPHEFHIGSDNCEVCQGDIVTYCTTCHGTGTVVDTDRSAALRKVAEWVARERRSRWCPDCLLWDAHADDCPYVLAKGVLA